MNSSPTIPDGYAPEEWSEDLFEAIAWPEAPAFQDARSKMEEMFYRKHPDDPFAQWKSDRLLAAYLWVRRHIEQLDRPNVAVVGDRDFAITIHLAYALYRVWTSVPDDRLSQDADVELIISLAHEQARTNEDGA